MGIFVIFEIMNLLTNFLLSQIILSRSMQRNKKTFLIDSFEDFCLMVFKYQEQIEKLLFFNLNDDEISKNNKIARIQNELYLFIKDKAADIFYESGKIGADLFKEASYVMASFADEIFLSLSWEGKVYWRNNLLEKKIFKSMHAGEKILSLIDKFLAEKNYKNDELGLIYYRLLSLGFKGKLKSFEGAQEIIQIKKEQLFFKVYSCSSKIDRQNENLFSQAYDFSYVGNNLKTVNPIKFWINSLCFLIFSYFLISHLLWHMKMYSLLKILNQFKEVLQ